MPKFLLTGVDGSLSSIAATYALTLAQPGDQIILTSPRPGLISRTLLDSWTALGAQILMVDYDDPRNLKRAFAGVDAVAFVSSPNYLAGPRRRRQHGNVVEAARAAGVGRIAYTSLVGAEQGAGHEADQHVPEMARDHAYTERLIHESGMAWNIQRNYLFVDTIAEVLAAGCGEVENDSKAAFVAREDCGRVLGALLMGKGERDTVYTVTGPKAVSHRELYEWMAGQPNSPVQTDFDEEEREARWRQRRLSDSWGRPTGLLGFEDVLGLTKMVTSGYLAGETDAVVRLTGRRPLDFEASLGASGGDGFSASQGMVPGAGRGVSC